MGTYSVPSLGVVVLNELKIDELCNRDPEILLKAGRMMIESTKTNTMNNICWMLRKGWSVRKSVLMHYAVLAIIELVHSLTELFLAPQILEQVDQKAPASDLLWTIAFFTLFLCLLSVFSRYLQKIAARARFQIRFYLLEMVMTKSNNTSYSNTLNPAFQKLKVGADESLENINMFWDTTSQLLTSIMGFAVYMVLLKNLPFLLMGTAFITSVLSYLIFRKTDTYRERHRKEESDIERKKHYIEYNSQAAEMAKDIRIFGLSSWLNDVLRSLHNLYRAFCDKAENWRLAGSIADVILTMTRNGICYYLLIANTLNGNLSASEFVLYFSAVTGFTTWITSILKQTTALRGQSLEITTMREFLDYPEPFRFSDGEQIPGADGYELIMDNVSFRYPGTTKDILHNINLTIPAGERLAIVGLNGAGKTTLVLLLCGLLDPTEGRVLLNGKDIRIFDRQNYYRLFSCVFQNYSLLQVSIAEEISLQMEHADRERVQQCLERSGLWEKVCELPDGMNTHTNRDIWEDGVQLSGGQIQRLLLARALYRDAPILLLDEPTAALDPLAENELYLKYDEMTAGKTSLFISHRLASTRFCDRVLFLKDGAIAEEGTHETLMKAGGEYATLFEVQSQYYQEGRTF